MKIKNRTIYDSIYQCLIMCRDNEKSTTTPTTRTRFMSTFGGNYIKFNEFTDTNLVSPGFIEVNPEIEHYRPVYRITDRGKQYIECYEKLMGLLGRKV